MALSDLKLNKSYKSLSCNMVADFYVPVLKETVIYKRAVGFFNSSAFYEISVGLRNLVQNDGLIQLIVSPKLEDEDIEAINKGYKTRDEVIEKAILKEISEPINDFQQKRLNFLANLIADRKLEIKVAFTKTLGIFHDKLGVMEDSENNKIAFSGSMNETSFALSQNYESIDVFRSWAAEDKDRVEEKVKEFDNLWYNKHPEMDVSLFPKVAIDKLDKYRKFTMQELLSHSMDIIDDIENDGGTYNNPTKAATTFFRTPNEIQLFDYQLEAINKWMENGSCGIFNMATGTGKTLTALGALSELSKKLKDNLFVIIICPYQHLVEQWVEDIEKFGVNPIVCYSNYNWKPKLKDAIRFFNSKVKKNQCIITTNATFAIDDMQKLISTVKGSICLVVDEAHNFGATKQRQTMSEQFKYRLALSATLERHHDEIGTRALRDYFGDECINYLLEQAIKEDKLCRYYYYPVPIRLTDEEIEIYNKLSEKISDLFRKMMPKDGEPLPQIIERLLIKRARIIAGAKNKLTKLYELMKEHKDENNILVYCGAVQVPNENYCEYDYDSFDDEGTTDYKKSKRQIDVVADMLGNKLDMRISKFTADEKKDERELIKRDFVKNVLQCVVAIKCLDEGVNIPGIKTAFILASSTNPKEYIQRRGRVLRKAKDKPFAYIYDFITLPCDLNSKYVDAETAHYELALLKKEKTRMEDFQALCENKSEVDKLIVAIEELYDLNKIGGYYGEF